MRANSALASMITVLSLVLSLVFVAPRIAAQEAPPSAASPPEVGAIVVADSLVGTGRVTAWTCPNGRGKIEPVGEGIILKVTGRCSESESDSDVWVGLPIGVVFPDGEIRIEVKVVSGHERAYFVLGFRDQADVPNSYTAGIVPSRGFALLARGGTVLQARRDLAGLLARDDWNSIAVRARGPDFWLFVNDQLVVQASDSGLDRGGIVFELGRQGDPNDTPESAAVIRNFRVSHLLSGDPSRAPAIVR